MIISPESIAAEHSYRCERARTHYRKANASGAVGRVARLASVTTVVVLSVVGVAVVTDQTSDDVSMQVAAGRIVAR